MFLINGCYDKKCEIVIQVLDTRGFDVDNRFGVIFQYDLEVGI
jgi:hypothetical protein